MKLMHTCILAHSLDTGQLDTCDHFVAQDSLDAK